MPLATLLTRRDRMQQLARQHATVVQLRRTLGVGGHDLEEADIRWTARAQPA
jgi:hypothetical protein